MGEDVVDLVRRPENHRGALVNRLGLDVEHSLIG